ncbi:MAG: efflux RND transporter periplasmic adaptor subunit [Desulfovibrio sp.]
MSVLDDMKKKYGKRLLFIPAVLFGVLIFVMMVKGKSVPTRTGGEELSTSVRYIKATKIAYVPRALGYGYIQPGQVWDGVAEVGGRIVWVNPDLKKGAVIAKGDVLLKINPEESGLAKDQIASDVEDVFAQIRKLDQKEKDTRRSLSVEQRSLQLSKKELDRRKELVDSGTIAKSEFDSVEKQYLTQKNAVQNYKATINSIPSERATLMARLNAARSRLRDAELEIEKTVVVAPFDCRISVVNIELAQFATVGQVLVSADSMAASEAYAQVPLHAMRAVVPDAEISPFQNGISTANFKKFLNINAVVRLDIADMVIEWNGRLSRVGESVDPKTRTLGVYVVVDNPYLKVKPGKRPPLLKNMFCEVELRGEPRTAQIIVPRSAVRNDKVYVVDDESRLKLVSVDVLETAVDFAAVKGELSEGDKLIVSDLVPAVEGMLLTPVEDLELETRLREQAEGAGTAR